MPTIQERHKVFQATTDDCLKCCIATVMRRSYDVVPNFYEGCKQAVPVPVVLHQAMLTWFTDRGYYLIEVPMSADSVEEITAMLGLLHPGLNVMLSGKSPRGLDHAVIVRDGEMIHDPSRSGGGIIGPCYTGLYYAGYIGFNT